MKKQNILDTNNIEIKSFEDVQKKAIEFAKNRGWYPQSPEDLAKSIIIEAAELLEHFQWDKHLTNDREEKNWEEISSELADILIYIIGFANNTQINLVEAVSMKLDRLEVKYPAHKFQDGHNDKFYREQKEKYRKGRK